MKINEIKNVFAFCMGCLALLAGCAGFTEDVNGNVADHSDEANQIESQYALARVAQSGKVERSAAGDSITIVLEINGGCVKEGESFAYDENFYFADSLTFAYSFLSVAIRCCSRKSVNRTRMKQTRRDTRNRSSLWAVQRVSSMESGKIRSAATVKKRCTA